MSHRLEDLLLPGTVLSRKDNHYEVPIESPSTAIQANDFYFSNPDWAKEYLQYCHRSDHFRNRWQAASGDWTGKIVVDVGCGPGNVFATLGGNPALLVGVDVAAGRWSLLRSRATYHCVPMRRTCPSDPPWPIWS